MSQAGVLGSVLNFVYVVDFPTTTLTATSTIADDTAILAILAIQPQLDTNEVQHTENKNQRDPTKENLFSLLLFIYIYIINYYK